MPITIGANISSLRTQRQLGKTTDDLARVYERLSSGQRINHASDDAAGLSIASQLNSTARIQTQAIRNVSDGISLFNIADGALESLTSVMQRVQELAEQAANGSYSTKQRLALQKESDALIDEYNRIVSTTQFNGISVLQSPSDLSIQVGNGSSGSISFLLGSKLAHAVGDGTFRSSATFAGAIADLDTGDFNHDGKLDIVANGASASLVYLGNGDGSFSSAVTLSASANNTVAVADMNGDGNLDVVAGTNNLTGRLVVYLGNGNGSFAAGVSYLAGYSTQDLILGDFNGDGTNDAIVGNTDGGVHFMFGNGDGSFRLPITYNSGGSFSWQVRAGDFNGDGKLDFGVLDGVDFHIQLFLNNGLGSFTAATSFAAVTNFVTLNVADFNRDGKADIAAVGNTTGAVYLFTGNGDGTFSRTQYSSGANAFTSDVGDVNGDGIQDLVVNADGGTSLVVLLGNADGTFKAGSSSSTPGGDFGMAVRDFNNDGVLDVTLTGAGLVVDIGNAQQSARIGYVTLVSQSGARSAIDTAKAVLNRIAAERGEIGASMSRLDIGKSYLNASRENYLAAASRIMDADIADESANLTRQQILQQVASAVLAQANQTPALGLRLLNG